MAGIESSEDNPLNGISTEQADLHYREGGGSPVYIDRSWYMNEGPGTAVNLGSALVIERLGELGPGTVVQLDRNSYPRTPGIEPDEIAHDFYVSHGRLSDEAYIYGDASFVVRGTIEVLENGRYRVDLEMRPYDDQFGFENNGQGGFLETLRAIGGLWAGSGTGYQIEYRGAGSGRVIRGEYTHEELMTRFGPPPECFPAHTPIAISLTETRPIADIRVGDTVLAFDPAADLGRGALVPRKVVRLYRNTTEEWVKLTWAERGEQRELVTTPGHHFLDRFGRFPTIECIPEDGPATVVRTQCQLYLLNFKG